MAARKSTPSPEETTSEDTEQRTIPVHKQTRDRVNRLKGERTYEEIISEWADEHGNDERSSAI